MITTWQSLYAYCDARIGIKNKYITNDLPYEYTLDPGFTVYQKINEKGLVVVSGALIKPFTTENVKLSIKYQDSQGNWIVGWCKTLYSYNQYNENLIAKFELPANANNSYNLKIDLSSNSNLTNWNQITWSKTVKHYKFGDYTPTKCELDENEYTILLTPKKEETLITDLAGKVTGVRDRVTSTHSWNKLSNVLMNNKLDNVIFKPKEPAQLITEGNGAKSIRIVNNGAITDTIASTPQFIYQEGSGHPLPYLYSYDDPIYIFAGKFSINGFLLKFSQWPNDSNGPGYHNFKNPNSLQSRYFNTYNTIYEKLSDIISDQEPVVFVSSLATGFRVYKQDGSFINLTGYSNYGALFFGYGNDQGGGRRGPGSENFLISNTSDITIYGMGALRNNTKTGSFEDVHSRSIEDINKEINKFINYTGIFGASTAYEDNTECSANCFSINSGANSDYAVVDWTKAPNSYIFTGKDKNGNEVDGLYIPVKKAYEMWRKGKYIQGSEIPLGTVTSEVLWEDNIGLIKSGENYKLEIIGSGENSKIKVPISKVKKGNAVVAFKVNGEIFWSWHIWVTDDPTKGAQYKSYANITRELSDGTIENIPDNEWGWMDRNLGAIGNSITGDGWNKNGGLLYQWGRKDPIPPLVTKGDGFYEVNGSLGKVLHRNAHTQTTGYVTIDSFTKYVNQSNANIVDNLKLSIKNPLSLIYVNQDGTNTQAYYNNSNGVYSDVNWFGNVDGLQTYELSKVNLWSDNSMGIVDNSNVQNYNDETSAKPYRNKSSYDPCPNGWRIPSVLVAHITNNIRIDYSPFGIKENIPYYQILVSGSNIKPGNGNMLAYLKGIKVYPQFGFDMTNVNGNNMGIFPGTGMIDRRDHTGQYSDSHETYLWTATMTMWDTSNLPWATSARALRLIPDATQIINNYKPDATNYPNVFGLYNYLPLQNFTTNRALGCRCVKDPLYIKNNYDFPTEFFIDSEKYLEGLDNPNSYIITKSTETQTVKIPISKAFSVQSNFLGNPQILNPSNFNDLKVNVLWTDNTNLISLLKIDNTASKEANISAKINPNQSGNAVVTLHNGSIKNPIYWSWHVWVTNTPINTFTYINDTPIPTDNYTNYTQYGNIMKTKIMDRNIGAVDAFPTLSTQTPNTQEKIEINNSQGLHFQWGRKDPLPVFLNIYNTTSYNIFLGTTSEDGNTTYTILNSNSYNSLYPTSYNNYKSSILPSDKIDDRISKILKYSVENPLRFLKPDNSFAPYPNSTNPVYTNGSDWLFDNEHSNLFAERWGWGTKKSVFDPCPDGWRIPETITGAVDAKVVKNSPWSLKNNKELTNSTINNTEAGYFGVSINEGWGATRGFIFNNSAYYIGNYPKGYIRGQRSVVYPNFPINHDLSLYNSKSLSGIWYANLTTGFYGRGNYLGFDRFGRMQISNNDIDPYSAMNCRCVKQEDNNSSRGPIPTLPVTFNTGMQAKSVFSKEMIVEKQKNNKFIFYPNPVKDILFINNNDKKTYYYQIYNMLGQKIHEGKFENNKTDISSLSTGIYFIRLNDSEQIIKIIKH